MELRWQKDVIEMWLKSAVTPDSRTQLEELLSSVDQRLAEKDEGLTRGNTDSYRTKTGGRF